jgi:hypothetical protein
LNKEEQQELAEILFCDDRRVNTEDEEDGGDWDESLVAPGCGYSN